MEEAKKLLLEADPEYKALVAKKEADEAWFANLIGQYQELVEKGEKALDDADWTTLGQLLNENHTLCQSLTVSCKELDTLVALGKVLEAESTAYSELLHTVNRNHAQNSLACCLLLRNRSSRSFRAP